MKSNISVREPVVAGQFYDDDPERLKNQINDFLSGARAKLRSKKRIYALIVPHAGYLYSGKTAAEAFSLIEEVKYKRALIIAPSHRYRFQGLAYASFDRFSTPLGELLTDKDSIAKIANSSPFIQNLDRVHSGEHSLEVELPFLQTVQSGIKIMPFICGSVNDCVVGDLSRALLDYINEENIWLISSDFTHYGYSFGYMPFSTGDIVEKIRKLDLGAIDKILNIDYDGFRDYIEGTGATICGANPIKILLKTLENVRKKGETINAELISYANSAELSGDGSHCVSYASIAFTQPFHEKCQDI